MTKIKIKENGNGDLPGFDGESESGSHAGLGIGADIVGEAIGEPSMGDSEGLVSERMVQVHAHQLQRPKSLFLRHLRARARALYRKQIHSVPLSLSLLFGI